MISTRHSLAVRASADYDVRLAPLYDVASYWPYDASAKARGVKLAMSIGGEYRVRYVESRH